MIEGERWDDEVGEGMKEEGSEGEGRGKRKRR